MSALEDLILVILWINSYMNGTNPPADVKEALERLKRRLPEPSITNDPNKNSS